MVGVGFVRTFETVGRAGGLVGVGDTFWLGDASSGGAVWVGVCSGDDFF